MNTQLLKCPRGHTELLANRILKETTFRGKNIKYEIEIYICNKCKMEIGTVDQAAKAQLAIAEAYRKETGLLTSAEIKHFREQSSWSQKKLAQMTGLGIASIKRWELGIIQTKSMDKLLRDAFKGHNVGNVYTGNRKLSLERIKLVIKEFEKALGFQLLKEGDRLLYDAKYTWFADMYAHKLLGRSMTGATYAALPHGPQLNNYRELVDLIRDADEANAEPLSEDEKRIIAKIAGKFPTKQMVFDASHREPAWKNKDPGDIIPYSDSYKLQDF
jgi:putative zinc finger/helix-turn-helix YgiT family protein